MTRFAALISRLSHPFLVPIPALVAALRLDGVSWRSAFAWSAICIAVGIAPTALLLVVQRWRASAAGSALLLAHLAPTATLPLAAAVALVAWSRLRLEQHTPAQVALGAGVAASCMAASLAAFGV